MGDEGANIEFSRKNEASNFLLQKKIGGVAANQVFLVHANCSEIERSLVSAAGVGGEQELGAAPDQLLGLAHHSVGKYREFNGGAVGVWCGFFQSYRRCRCNWRNARWPT